MTDVRIMVAYNPRSGRGRGVRAARAISASLDGKPIGARTCRVRLLELGPQGDLAAELRDTDVLAIAGGDGSVHHLAPLAAAAGVPLYHVPCGNENLLAREFGMDDTPATLSRAIEAGRIVRMDTATFSRDGRDEGRYLLMCSFGPDASVIHRLTKLRTRALGHAAYIEPVLRELVAPCYARLTVEVDGEHTVGRAPGVLLVANSRQYAARIDPAVRASVTDGLLDVVFLPCSSRTRTLAWGVRSRLRRHTRHAGVIYRQGRHIAIQSEEPVPLQIDGECPDGDCGVLRGRMEIRVQPASLPVIVPP